MRVMKFNILSTLLGVALLCSCQPATIHLSGRFVGNDATTVYLEQVTASSQRLIDSATLTPSGDYRFTIKGAEKSPLLYNLLYAGERIPLLLSAGERVEVGSVGSVVRNYTLSGSEESALLREFYQPFVAGAQQLERLSIRLADENLSEDERQQLVKEYSNEYYKIRREQLRFIVSQKASLAAVYALYQRLPGDYSLFNGEGDVVYYRTVAEALRERYPDSVYLQALEAEIARMEARFDLASKITELNYPDLELPDIYGKKQRLSSLAGKVILLDFWSAELGNSNVANAELKQTYQTYAPKGFEVYQVGIDTSKALWITSVQEQALPWISVSDLRGGASRALLLYNVQKLPANFLINKEGSLIAKDIYGEELERKLAELTR